MNETIEKVITFFRKRRDVSSDRIYESLLGYGVEPDSIQVIYQHESPEFFTFFNVHTLPTVLLFSEGDEVKRLVGKEIEVNALINFLK
jgi:thiol-disulfide isomerase/thioredoxin